MLLRARGFSRERFGRWASGTIALLVLTMAAVPACRSVRGAADEFSSPGEPPQEIEPDDVARGVIDGVRLMRAVEFLASDGLRGRATPSPGLERAAAWLGAELQRAGLRPAGEDGGYVQYWPAGVDSVGGPALAPNVGALLPGADTLRSGEFVVITAHLDHRGVTEPAEDGDSIHNGAAGAAGVAVLVEVARALAKLPTPSPRPVLFLVFSGTQDGLRGSRWYAERPTVELGAAVAVLNLGPLAGVPGNGPRLVGPGAPALGALFDRVVDERRIPLVPKVVGGDAPLDHRSFEHLGVPVASLIDPDEVTGSTADEADRVDQAHIVHVTSLVFFAVHELASEGLERQRAYLPGVGNTTTLSWPSRSTDATPNR